MTSRRRSWWVAAPAGLVAAWLLAGAYRLDPEREFAVVTGPLVRDGARVYQHRSVLIAPPGLCRVSVFSRGSESVPLPDAARAMLPGADGSRFGLVGTVLVSANPERGRELATAASGDGIAGVVLAATRASAPVFDGADRDERGVSTRKLAFERRLAEELARRGATLESLSLEGFDDLSATKPIAPVPPDVKVLLVGLDGADWAIVDPLMAAGRMPNLQKLVQGGVRANLLSITPMLSPVIWTSIATGVEPSRHGVMDFLVPTASGSSEPVTSAFRNAPALWELLSEAGVRVGVTGWWATWPASQVNGFMVTDRLAYQLFGYSSDPRSAAGKTWPPEAYATVRPLIVPADAIPWSEVQSYLDGPRTRPEEFDVDERERLDQFRTLLAAGKTYLDSALAMRRQWNPSFEAVYFEGTDTASHLFMSYRPPRLATVDARGFASFRSVVDRSYENADRTLGRLLEDRAGWTVIVVSDHGFASDASRPLTTDSRIGHGAAADWHRRFGVFVMNGPGVNRGMRLEEASVYDIAPTILALFQQPIPKSWPGRVLGAALTPEWRATHAVRMIAVDPVRPAASAPVPDDDRESLELRAKLQSLGYLGASDTVLTTTKNNKGAALLGAGKFKEAAAVFRQALAEQPGNPTLMINLGVALRFAGERGEARALFEKAFQLQEGRRSAGTQLAQLKMEDHDLVGAERTLRLVLETERDASDVHNALGLVLEKMGRVEEAAREYAESARLDASSAEPRNNLGNLARQARRDDEAERWYLQAIAVDPYFIGAYNNLALLCQDRGQIDRAIDLYGRALAKAPDNAVVMSNLAALYFATGETREARTLWRRAADADPKYASPLNNLAGLALSEGDTDAAEGYLERALKIDPEYGDARLNRSILLRQRGDLSGARSELELATKDPRSSGTAWVQLGLLDLESGAYREAVAALEQARLQLGDRTDVLNGLGETYSRLNDRPKAVAVLKRSLALDPEQPNVRSALQQLDNQ